MLDARSCGRLLGIDDRVPLDPEEMARDLALTVYPRDRPEVTAGTEAFAEELVDALSRVGASVLPYDKATEPFPLSRAAKLYGYGAWNSLTEPLRALAGGSERQGARPGLDVISHVRLDEKVRRGVSIMAVGPGPAGDLPVDHTQSFRDTTIFTVIDWPVGLSADATFEDHYRTALELFATHMTNVVLAVDDDRWLLYNFNGAHPVFPRSGDLDDQVLGTLVPKLAAPIRPPRLSEFVVRPEAFEPDDRVHRDAVKDMVESGALLETTGLYPPGLSLETLPWRNPLYRWAGAIHLDDRTGMSYGFLARQLPTDLPELVPAQEAQAREDTLALAARAGEPVTRVRGTLHVRLELSGGAFWLRVPPVWVLTQRSGANKTNMRGREDLVRMGLVDGQMVLEAPRGVPLREGYRPSFDSRVILAHALGNALAGAVLDHLHPGHPFPEELASQGMAMAHFHGYLDRKQIPGGWHVHGQDEPHVSCGTPQSALYALLGKLEALETALSKGNKFLGDVHIEPQHGTIVSFPTLRELGEFLAHDKDVAKLGNAYWGQYG